MNEEKRETNRKGKTRRIRTERTKGVIGGGERRLRGKEKEEEDEEEKREKREERTNTITSSEPQGDFPGL